MLSPELERRLLTPALIVDMDSVRANIERLIELAGGEPSRLRPHLKTTKIPEVWDEFLARGVRHFKCATLREARVLLALASRRSTPIDLLVAYPHVGPKLAALGELGRDESGHRLAVLVESVEGLRDVPDNLDVFVDIDPGMGRSGIPLQAGESIAAVAEAAGDRLGGLHFYDGHRLEHGAARRSACFAGYERLMETCSDLRARGLAVHELVTSGTPAFVAALEYPAFGALTETAHRVSPGTIVFHDTRSEELHPELGFQPAATVAARVVSRPAAMRFTCDAGSKSIAAEAGDPCALVLGHTEWIAQTPSEEHLPMQVLRGAVPERGTLLQLVPRHVCPTVNLAESAVLIERGAEPRVVPVAARAHEIVFVQS